jgi:hypothetical protein
MSRDHYVSRFHLREFCDPTSLSTPDPWLWLGTTKDNIVKRRSPKNVAIATDLFAGPGGLKDRETTLETFLANEVENPAAFALRALSATTVKTVGSRELPDELMRYLAWAASRSLTMQRLHVEWTKRMGSLISPVVEPPPDGLLQSATSRRPVRMLNPESGQRVVANHEEAGALLECGWLPDPTEPTNFLSGVHIQAFYFQERWFPRLQWFTLRPPPGSYFVIGDRPVGWGVPDRLDAPSSCLRDPAAFLIAPLSRTLVLVGRNSPAPWSVSPRQINAILAAWSHDWIAGPTLDCVTDALRDRADLTAH